MSIQFGMPYNDRGLEKLTLIFKSFKRLVNTVETQTGLRLERRGEGDYYKVILHIKSTLIPISDDIIEELQNHTGLPPNQFFSIFLEKVGYSSYLQEQIRQVVKEGGDFNSQLSTIQQFFRKE